MAKSDKFYFENFVAGTQLSKDAACYLVECLENYDPAKIDQMLVAMHQLEHRADEKKHEMGAALAKAFVTPVDREDLDMLSRQLDDVTDNIEEVLQMFYINNIQQMKPSAVEFAKNIVRSCELLCELMREFENFKKSKKIKQLIIALNDVEEQCDSIYLHAMRELATGGEDALTVIGWRDVYGCLEACADAIEHASDCVDSVIMKNT